MPQTLLVPAPTEISLPSATTVFTTRLGGRSKAPFNSLNLALHVGDDPRRVRDNRQVICDERGLDADRAVYAQQVHGTLAAIVDASHAGRGGVSHADAIAGADALVTSTPNLPLVCFSADCVLLALVDPTARVLGVLHAGWRGMAAGIIENTLEQMRNLGAHPARMHVTSGAFIRDCCFETGADVAEALGGQHALQRDGRVYFDLEGATRARLQQCGVAAHSITFDPRCTCCEKALFFSHRRTTQTGGKHTGRMALIAMLTNP